MSKLKSYFERFGVEPHEISIEGFFQPQYLIVHINYQVAIWKALDGWLKEIQGNSDSLDLSDPWDRMGVRAIIVREHEMAHYYSFLVNPFATTIQCLSFLRDLQIILFARILRENGIKQLVLPLNNWRDNFSLSSSVASRLQEFEDRFNACSAVLGMLQSNPRDLPVPENLIENSRDRKFWPWLKFCKEIQKRNKQNNGFSFLDIHEGFSVISEIRSMYFLGLSMNNYLRVRRGLYAAYALMPSVIEEIIGGWNVVTAGIALSIISTLPAVAVLCGGDDPGRFDAFTCFLMVMEKMKELGNASEYMKKNIPLEEYIQKIIGTYYPGFDPAGLLQQENRKKIEEAFGIDELRTMQGLHLGLPVLSWLERSQDQISHSLHDHWALLFMPVGWDTDNKWWPPIIWFKDNILRFTDPETYSKIRWSFIAHLITESLWQRHDLDRVARWCPGGLEVDSIQIDGREETAGYFLETLTGYSLASIQKK